jgi:polysaccharide biosynthesis transport protein
MAEELEEQASQGLDLQRYLNTAKRRHLQFLVPAFLGWLVVWGSSWFLQARYKSGTTILVEAPTISRDYVTPNINDDLQERLQSIKQQVLSRTRLLAIIDRFHLYSGGRRQLTPDDKVAMMSKDIDIELYQDPHNERITSFSISYSASSPFVAQAVATNLADLFINANTNVTQQESENTTDFLKKQLELARTKLQEQEAKVKAFEATHEGSLPEQDASNLQVVSSASAELQSANAALATARGQREFIQLEINEAQHGAVHSPDGKPTGLAGLDLQLEQLNSKLDELLSTHTEQYPDVIQVRQQIAATQKAREKMAEEISKRAAGGKGDDLHASDDPALSSSLLQLQGQLRSNQMEITNREREVSDLKAKIAKYEALEGAEPSVEQQLADLKRGYDESQKDFDDLQKKVQDSERATYLQKTQQGEQFKVLDPAPLPAKPDFPNRLKFCGMGLAAGIGLGLVLVVGLEFLDDRMHSDGEIKALLPVAVLSEIPEVLSTADVQQSKRKAVMAWVATGCALAVILAGSAFSYLHN